MGMDVTALNPVDPDNNYFRANVWRWRGIHEFMSRACKHIYGKELDIKMAYNDGAGIPSDLTVQCADAMQVLYDSDFKSLTVWNPYPHDVDSDFKDAYVIPTSRLQDWIDFVRNSGGFEVW